MLKFAVTTLVAVLLAGCAPHVKHVVPQSKPSAAMTHYAQEMQKAIYSKFDSQEAYSGKACTLRVNLTRDAVLNSVQAEGGDPELCSTLIAAMRTVAFPAFTDETYEAFHNAPIDFKF